LIKTIEAGQNEIMRLEIEGSRNYRYQLQMASNSSTNFQNINADLTDLSNIQIRSLDVRNSYYCFRVITLDECGSNNAQSAIFCSIATQTTAEHKVNLIEWNTEITPAGGNLTVIRDAQPIANFPANQQFYRDRDVLCNQFYRYQMRLETPQGQVSTSFGIDHFTRAFEKPDSVSGKAIAPSIEGIALAWKADPSNPAWYYIYRIESGQRTLVDSTRETSYVERGLVTNSPRVCYEITFKDDCLVESVTGPGTCFSTGNNLVFPNAIMPDGSMAINREFKPIGEFFGRYMLIISNGYGEEIFRSQEIDRGWDGTHNGQSVPLGAYPYRVELVNLGGKRQTFSGTVTVVR
jgi:hypothetical protein